MDIEIYLADVEEPALWDTTEPVLVIFLHDGLVPPPRLVDPDVVGLSAAEGQWELLLWDHDGRRAFYEKIDRENDCRQQIDPGARDK